MKDFFRLNILLMIAVGFWPFPNTKQKEKNKICRAIIIWLLSTLISFGQVYNGIEHSDNLVIFFEGVAEGMASIISNIKAIVFITRREYIRNMFNMIYDLYENTPLGKTDRMAERTTKKWKQKTNLMIKLLVTIYFGTWTLHIIFLPFWNLFMSSKMTYPLPAKIPFEVTNLQRYFFVYTYEFIMALGTLAIFVINETLFAALLLYICSRVEILEYTFNLAADEAIREGKITALFGKSVEYHSRIFKLVKLVENLYSPLLLLQFMFSAIVICVECFLSTLNIGNGKQTAFLTLFVSLLTQLFIYCFFGNVLQTKFEYLRKKVVESMWYRTPIPYQKNMVFLIARCNKQVFLTAHGMMPVNLASFFVICKTSLSYLALLQSMAEKQGLK